MARLMVKVASLSKQEQTAFKKQSEGRYVLAKVLQKYDWDSGSVWSLIKDPSSGDLVLARDEEKFQKTASMNILSTKLVCDTCRRDLDEVIVSHNIYKLCARCDGPTIQSMKEAALTDSHGYIGDPSAGTGINIQAIAEPLPSRLTGYVRGWVEAGLDNFSDEALGIAITTAHRAGLLSNADAHLMGAALPLVREAAQGVSEGYDMEASLGNPFADGEMAQDMHGHIDMADRALAALKAITPKGMKIATAQRIAASLRTQAAPKPSSVAENPNDYVSGEGYVSGDEEPEVVIMIRMDAVPGKRVRVFLEVAPQSKEPEEARMAISTLAQSMKDFKVVGGTEDVVELRSSVVGTNLKGLVAQLNQLWKEAVVPNIPSGYHYRGGAAREDWEEDDYHGAELTGYISSEEVFLGGAIASLRTQADSACMKCGATEGVDADSGLCEMCMNGTKKVSSAKNDWVSAKIKKLINDEGYEQKQAIAIAEEMYRKKTHQAATLDPETLEPTANGLTGIGLGAEPGEDEHEQLEVLLFNDLEKDLDEEKEIVDVLQDMHEDVDLPADEDLELGEEL